MHYEFSSCGIKGNYDYTGLSKLDRLGLHILYPENGAVAEYVGTTVVESTQPVKLQSAWKARGANMPVVATGFIWVVNGSVKSTTPDLSVVLPLGVNTFVLSHFDLLGRVYTYSGTITVLLPTAYDQFAAATSAAGSSLL